MNEKNVNNFSTIEEEQHTDSLFTSGLESRPRTTTSAVKLLNDGTNDANYKNKMYETSSTAIDSNIGGHLKGSRFHVKSSKRTLEDFEFDEQFMIDAITEHYRARKTGISLKKKVFYFLNYPRTLPAYLYHSFTFVLCVVTIILSITFTVSEFRSNYMVLVSYTILEIILATMYLIELCLHVWCCNIKLRYKKRGRLSFLWTVYSSIDIFIILSIVIKVIVMHTLHPSRIVFFCLLSNEFVMALQFFQTAKMLHYERYCNTFKMMGLIIWRHRKEILSSYLIILYMIISLSFLFFIFEYKSVEAKLKTLPDSFYYSVISFATIGYGDIHPTTVAGKMLVSIFSFFGIALVALPSGIIGSGFALQLAYEEKKKRIANRQEPAVTLIQTAWRRHSLLTKGRASKCYKKLYVALATHSGSVIPDIKHRSETFDNKKVRPPSTQTYKKSNFKVEDFNAAENSATITVFTGNRQKPLLTFIKIPDKIANTKLYKNVFRFLSEIHLNVALKNFKIARKQDSTLESIVNKIQRQNVDIIHHLYILSNYFENEPRTSKKIVSKASLYHHSFAPYTSLCKKKKLRKMESLTNTNSNVNTLDARLNRIERALEFLTEQYKT